MAIMRILVIKVQTAGGDLRDGIFVFNFSFSPNAVYFRLVPSP